MDERAEIKKPRGGGNRESQAGINIIIGKRGFGKSFFVENYSINQHPRNLILSHLSDDYIGIRNYDSLDELGEIIDRRHIYTAKTNLGSQFTTINFAVWMKGDLHYIIEESNRYLKTNQDLDETMENLILRGRHKNIDMTFVSQRFSAININVRSQYSRIFAFNQSQSADIRDLEQMAGDELPAIRKLQVGEYYEISPWSDLSIKKLNF